MKKIILYPCQLVLLALLMSVSVFSQAQDTLANDQVGHLMRQLDSTRYADSLRRVVLQNEIEKLRGTNTLRQRELVAQLKQTQRDDSLKKVTMEQRLRKLKQSSVGYPVAPFRDTLFFVYTTIGSFTAKERASAITDRIRKLYDNYGTDLDSIVVVENETSMNIVYQDNIVMTVTDLDAMWVGKTAQTLSSHQRDLIKNSISQEREANSIMNLAIRVGAIILIIGGVYGVIRLIYRLFRKLKSKVFQAKDTVFTGVKIGTYQFLDRKRILQVTFFLLNLLRLLVILVSLYIALPLLFSIFPWTQGIADTLISWILSPVRKAFGGLVAYLPNLITIIVIMIITYYFARFLKFIAGEIENGSLVIPGFYADWAKPTLNIVKFLLYAFSFIVIFPYLPGSDSPIFQGVSVFVGILFSLGSSSAISNAVAGLVITYMRPFKVGDRIRIGEHTGDVIEKSLLVTRIRTIKNEDITIPNASVLSGHTINYTTSAKELGLILHSGVTIGYDVPWTKVHDLLIAAAKATRGIMTENNKEPFVLQTSLDDFYVSYQINLYTEESHRIAAIYSELHQHIQDKFNEAGVEILSPHYRAARDGNMTTIPPDYLPKDYKSPSFQVSIENSKSKTE